MDGPSLIFIIVPVTIPIALLMGIALPLIAGRPARHSRPWGRLARTGALKRTGAAREKRGPSKRSARGISAEYLYVSCINPSAAGYRGPTRCWVQEVPIVRKTAKWIYYTSETWDRREAVVRPGCISRQEFETEGVIPIPGDHTRPGPAGRLFFATREAAEADLYRADRKRAAQEALSIKELRRVMADAHPDRGGTAEKFIQARRRYERALRPAQPVTHSR